MRWQTINGSEVKVRCWNDEFVVYNTLSGDTHILERQTADVLLAVQAYASDVPYLAQILSGMWRCEMNEALIEKIESALMDMQALSLVEPVRS